MKIVVLDGYALNPGDLSWEGLNGFGELVIYDRTPEDKIFERSKDAEILYTNKTPLNAGVLNNLPFLKYIGVLATGYNIIDIDAASKQGITVTNVPAYSTHSVAQLTFALLLELCLHVQKHSDSVFEGQWTVSKDFSYRNYPLAELTGKTLGLIGFGNIGRNVADIATVFGMKIISYSRTQTDQSHRADFRWVKLDELFELADVVSVHCPLVAETHGLVNIGYLKRMKKSAFFLNTSRGQVIVEEDLAFALNNDIIAGAGIDVLSSEPPSPDNPLLKAKNCIITPHIAWATLEARNRLMDITVSNLSHFLRDMPVNVVSK